MIIVHKVAVAGKSETFTLPQGETPPQDSVWIDLFEPTRDEEHFLERHLAIEVPTRADMTDIEPSELLYSDNDVHYMTARVLCGSESDKPYIAAITFILTKTVLVTVRYDETYAFQMYQQHIGKAGNCPSTAGGVLAGLIEAISDRSAHVLNRVGGKVDELSHAIFNQDTGREVARQQNTLKALGRAGDMVSQVRESLVSVERMLLFISGDGHDTKAAPGLQVQARTTLRDQQSLEEHATFISGKIQFLLDAILGLINLDQNNIIKLFSVISVVFMPPTLIASIYGMNFKNIPELQTEYGYYFALAGMLASAVLPYMFFKWRRWL